MVRAAVLAQVGQPLEIRDDVEVEDPHAGEVQVRMVASGVCHSDLSAQTGVMMMPTPVVLGHEGAGVVEQIGPGVTSVRPGDHVLVTWVPQCGACYFCRRDQGHLCEQATVTLASGGLLDGTTRLTSQGSRLYQMAATGTFGELVVTPESGVVKLPPELDLTVAALLGCSVLTGVGAVTNTARLQPGDTVAVVGCGGVGLNVIQGARIEGAGRIIAVDTNPAKLALAARFGATDAVDASAVDAVSGVMALTDQRGVDVAFEVVGLQRTIDQAITMTRRGGLTVLVGVPAMDVTVTLPAFFGVVLAGKTLSGCWYGSANVRRDVPRLIELYQQGRLLLEELVSERIGLGAINDALSSMGEGARSVITDWSK
jgi:S-(hydroxymethyl)glutathione dehydrogenase/alcohol dehydrogenase